ncbi:hypothetical protein ACVBEH_17860 [Roseateles sp. GG27B]
MLPKPDVAALTGGYRRTPFLQIGGDIYCDTALMCRVIEASHRPDAVSRSLGRHGTYPGALGRYRPVLGRHSLRHAAGRSGSDFCRCAARVLAGLCGGPRGDDDRLSASDCSRRRCCRAQLPRLVGGAIGPRRQFAR